MALAWYFTDRGQIKAIAHYVDDGGVLLIDCPGYPGEFYYAVRESLLDKAFPDRPPQDIPGDHPLLTASADGISDIGEPRLCLYARANPPVNSRPKMLRHGKGWVIICPMDLTSGLLNLKSWGVLEYQSDYAVSVGQERGVMDLGRRSRSMTAGTWAKALPEHYKKPAVELGRGRPEQIGRENRRQFSPMIPATLWAEYPAVAKVSATLGRSAEVLISTGSRSRP